MSKRFIDTAIFDDEWFMNLSNEGKIGYFYFITKCDHAGILKVNERLFEFQTGVKFSEIIKGLANRIIRVKNDSYFMPSYIKYQYPNWPNSKVRQQDSAIKILESLGIDINLEKNKPLTKGYVNVHDNDSVNDTVNNIQGRIEKFKVEVMEFTEYKIDTLEDFINYWTEKNPNGKKFKAELEKTFEISRRLKTWKRNEKQFNKQPSTVGDTSF